MINTMDFKKQKYFLQNSKVYDQKIGKISFNGRSTKSSLFMCEMNEKWLFVV